MYNLNDVFVEHVFVRQRCFLASNRWFAKQLPSCWRLSRDVAVTATSPSGKMVNCYEPSLAILIFSATPSAVPPVRDRIIINASHPFKLVNFKQKCWHMRRQCVPGSFFRPHIIKRAWFEAIAPPAPPPLCCICLELFQDPRSLPCLHTFCRECIQRSLNETDHSMMCLSVPR